MHYEPVGNNGGIFKPLPMQAMIDRYKDKKHPQRMVATQLIYGEVIIPPNGTGLAADIIAKDEEQNLRFAYSLMAADLDPDVATSIGLRYSFNIKDSPDSIFYFRLTALVDTSIIKVAPVYFSIDRDYVNSTVNPPYRLYTESEDKGVKLHWVRGDGLSVYFIERSIDGVNFVRLNKNPFISSQSKEEELKRYSSGAIKTESGDSISFNRPPLRHDPFHTYFDSLPNNTTKYYYRVFGIDAFGDTSKVSEIISCQGQDAVALQPPSEVKAEFIGGKVKITWKEASDKSNLRGYVVSYAQSFSQDYYQALHEGLLPPGTTQLIHNSPSAGSNNIYYLSAIDNKGNYAKAPHVAIYVNDSIPPDPPRGVTAIVDTNGFCLISWRFNNEPDLAGYKVYFSRAKDDPTYNQLTDYMIETNLFLDNVGLDILNHEIYYKVVAVDRSGNHSEFSEVATAIIPDTIAPVAPIVQTYYVGDKDISIKYLIGNSDDMHAHYIIRRSGDQKWQALKTILQKDVQGRTIDFKDNILEGDVFYEYAMYTEDLVGNISELSQIIVAKISKSTLHPVTLTLKPKYISGEHHQINIKWEKPKGEEIGKSNEVEVSVP